MQQRHKVKNTWSPFSTPIQELLKYVIEYIFLLLHLHNHNSSTSRPYPLKTLCCTTRWVLPHSGEYSRKSRFTTAFQDSFLAVKCNSAFAGVKSYCHCKLENHWTNEWHIKHKRPREMDNLSTGIFKTSSWLLRLQTFWAQGTFFQSSFPPLSHPSSLFKPLQKLCKGYTNMQSLRYSYILSLKSSSALYHFHLRLLL